MWANGRIRPEIAHRGAKQTLFTRAADFCRRRGILKADPFAELERLGRRTWNEIGRGTRPLSAPELERMVLVAMQQERDDGRAQLFTTCRRSRVYIVARWTGYRREECRRLRWPMVHELWGARPAIEVMGKNGAIEYLALHADAIEVLKDQWDESKDDPKGRVFPVLPKPKTVDMDMWRAGIIQRDASGQFHKRDERGYIVAFHSLRKTLNREMRRGGVDAGLRRRIMRHQSENLTDFEYDMADYAELKDAVEKCPSVLKKVREALGESGDSGNVDNHGGEPPPGRFFTPRLARGVTGSYLFTDHTDAPAIFHHEHEGRRRSERPGRCGNFPDLVDLAGPRVRDPHSPPQLHAQGRGAVRQMRSGVRVPLPPLRTVPSREVGPERLSPVESGVPENSGAPDRTGNLERLLSELLRVLKGTEHDALQPGPRQQQQPPAAERPADGPPSGA